MEAQTVLSADDQKIKKQFFLAAALSGIVDLLLVYYMLVHVGLIPDLLRFTTVYAYCGVDDAFYRLIICILITGAFSGWALYASTQFKNLTERLKPLSSECQQIVVELEAARSLEELHSKFRQLIHQHPQFEPVMSRKYREIKSSFGNR